MKKREQETLNNNGCEMKCTRAVAACGRQTQADKQDEDNWERRKMARGRSGGRRKGGDGGARWEEGQQRAREAASKAERAPQGKESGRQSRARRETLKHESDEASGAVM